MIGDLKIEITEVALGSAMQREQRRALRDIASLPEEILSDILIRLLPKSIIRCRAVCKAWRRVTSDRAFLLAHHRRQPPRRLFSFVRDVGSHTDRLGLLDYCVEALDFGTHEFRSVARFTGEDYDAPTSDSPFGLHAACDGLLLMSHNNCLYLCNPTTRQWVWVFPPALQLDMVAGQLQYDTVAGLYFHGPSEYRVLYCRDIGLEPTMYFIKTVGSGNERLIWPLSTSLSVRKLLAIGSKGIKFKEPFLFHGNLHWLLDFPRWRNILVFDTVREVFQWLHAPVIICDSGSSLLEIDGMLALSDSRGIGASTVNLWLLQDYERMVWVHKYRIELQVMEISRFEDAEKWCYSHILSGAGDVLISGFEWQMHDDIKGNLLEKFKCNGRLLNRTAQILRETLVQNAIFQTEANESTHEPPFFRDL